MVASCQCAAFYSAGQGILKTMARRKPKTVAVKISRWDDRLRGHEHFLVQIYVNKRLVHKIQERHPMHRPPKRSFYEVATEWLHKNGYLPGLKQLGRDNYEGLLSYCDRNNIPCEEDYKLVEYGSFWGKRRYGTDV